MIRPPAVAGRFYPSDPTTLRSSVAAMIDSAEVTGRSYRVFVLPHAGHVFSGDLAAIGYANIVDPQRFVILCPTHRVGVPAVATPGATAFATPLGQSPVDVAAVEAVESLDQVQRRPDVHEFEHAIEVHLPFIQYRFGEVPIVPLAVGSCAATDVAEVIDQLWGDDGTVIIVSSDLSHFLTYDQARRVDADTIHKIEQAQQIAAETACGSFALNGLSELRQRRDLSATTLAYRNSGDVSGDYSRVVGYATIAMEQV